MRLSAARSVKVHAFGFRRSPFRRPTGTPWVLLQRSCRPLFFCLSLVFAAVLPTGAHALSTSTTTLSSSAIPSTLGQSVTFTATVVDTDGHIGTPTGTVTFTDTTTATVLGTIALNGAGQASVTTTTLTGGNHVITADYSGDVNFAVSTNSLTQQVLSGAATATALASSLNPSLVGQSVTFTATVTGVTTPTGTVTFTDTTTATVLGTIALNGAGQASVTTSSLTVGDHVITADYSGDAPTFDPSSDTLTQHVVSKFTSLAALVSSLNPSLVG